MSEARAAIVLCGGQSRRMMRDKALLPFGDETMLQRVVRLVGRSVETICVAAAKSQILPPLPEGVIVVRDQRADHGPLEGLLAGLNAVADRANAAFVTGCDAPLLAPKLIDRMFELVGDFDAATPFDNTSVDKTLAGETRVYPLASVLRSSVRDDVERLLSTDRRSMKSLLDAVRTRRVDVAALRDVDPDLASLRNINTQDDYLAALDAAGLAER